MIPQAAQQWAAFRYQKIRQDCSCRIPVYSFRGLRGLDEIKISQEIDAHLDLFVGQGLLRASFDSESNTYTVTPDEEVNGDFAILFLAGMVDTGRPVTIITPEGEYTLQVNPSEEMARESFLQQMDQDRICVGKILYSELQ